jgi:hypothetical protein
VIEAPDVKETHAAGGDGRSRRTPSWPVMAAFITVAGGWPAAAGAEETAGRAVASAAMGAGVLGGDAATAVDVGLELAGEGYAVGVGGRLHYTAGGGLRTEDWDELSEILGIIRYALYDRRPPAGGIAISAAAGELGDVRQGHGTVMAGYASGLSLDHGRFGAQVRAVHDALAAEVMIDDLVGPRIVGVRAAADVSSRTSLGVSFSSDLRAPARGGEEAIGIAAVDAELRGLARGGRYAGWLYLDGASAAGLGAGLHAGLGGRAELGQAGVQVQARAELRLASGGYIPGYFGPLYERDRRVLDARGEAPASQLDLARGGGLGGASGLGEVQLEWPGAASGSIGYATRPALADQLLVRAQAPYLDRVQAALWAAIAVGSGPGRGGALAAEVRARIRDPLVISFDVARIYRDSEAAFPEPVWTAIASVGAVFGE